MLEGHERFGLLEIEAAVLWAMGKKVICTPSKGGKGHVIAYGFTKKDAEPRRNAAPYHRGCLFHRQSRSAERPVTTAWSPLPIPLPSQGVILGYFGVFWG